MKIKQIIWVDDEAVLSGIWSTIFVQLPFEYNAVIKNSLHTYRWSIALRTNLIEKGTAENLDEAKQACQRAWEELIRDILEDDGGCDFCLGEEYLLQDNETSTDVFINDSFRQLVLQGDWSVEKDVTDIVYCPKCGRTLGRAYRDERDIL